MSQQLILKRPCPKCGLKKLLAGPFYDRLAIRCLNCGTRFRRRK